MIFSKRKFEHLWMLKKNIHINPILQNVYNKYGQEKIQILIIEKCSVEKLLELEQKYIDHYRNDNELILMNILLTAGNSSGYIPTQESREKRSKSMMGKNKNKKRSELQCSEQSLRQQGREITSEWKVNISKSLKGRPSPNKSKKFIIYKGKTYSFKEFSGLMKCDLSNLYTTTKEFTEKKYNCKLITVE
jgi:group I intron endonuclease